MKDPYPRGRWEPHRERWPPGRSDDAWNQSWDQAPYSDYLGGQPPSPSYPWQLPPPVVPHRPRSIRVAVGLMCLAAVLVAVWVVTHRPGLHATPVTTTITIPVINATWAPPSPGAAPAMTAEQAWKKWGNGLPVPLGTTVQLGLITQSMGSRSRCGFVCDGLPVRHGIAYRALNELAYGYYWAYCGPGSDRPASQCWDWTFLDANTGKLITGANYNSPRGPGP